ncbi:MAG TPA: TonB-dependent receptor [Terriglobales bacterium]|nr:TonB-dependent receptor [Terriglobales bacterium]
MKTRNLFLVGMLMIMFSALASAQVSTGTISGTVTDSTGAALPGVSVVVLNEETGISRTLLTDSTGRYSAPSLGLGSYRVTAKHQGLRGVTRSGIVLTVGREAVVDVSLGVGSVEQNVEVMGEAPLVESTTASLGSLVDARTMRSLPLNGRSWDQLGLLQPGVVSTSPGELTAAQSFGTGKRFSVQGQRSTSNAFLLDGTDINDQGNGTPGGAAGTNLGVETIQEFKILSSSFKAEYGRASGSVTTAVTRSGTNDLHGTAFGYIRNSAFDARNYFDPETGPPPFRRGQFGGVIGGPIVKNKTFFFGGYEGLRQGLSRTQVAIVPTAAAKQGILPSGNVTVNPVMQPYLDLYPLPNGRDFGDGFGEYRTNPTVTTNQDNFMVRLDHQLTSGTSLFGRYTYDKDNTNEPGELPHRALAQVGRRHYGTLQATSILSSKAVNNFRFAFNRSYSLWDPALIGVPDSLSFVPGQKLGGLIIGGASASAAITFLGSPSQGTAERIWAYNVFQWSDDFTYIAGKHTLKTGFNFERVQDNLALGNFVRGGYQFTSFANMLQGISNRLTVSAPLGALPTWNWRQNIVALYGQDDFAVNSRLTLNLGLRWEISTDPIDGRGQTSTLPSLTAPAMVVTDRLFSTGKKNLEPRVGLAWSVNESGSTVVRAAYGMYHNLILPWVYSLNLSLPPFYGRFITNNPPFPDASGSLTAGASATTLFGPQDTPTTHQYNLSIQQQLTKDTVLQVAYIGNRGYHLQTSREANTPNPTFVNGEVFYPSATPKINPNFSSILHLQMNGTSSYNAGQITLRKQTSSGLTGQIFYTYSKSLDINSTISGADSRRSPQLVQNPYDIRADWGRSDFDQTHALGFNFSYPLPWKVNSTGLGALVNGWSIDGIAQITSGQPFTVRLTSAVSRDGAQFLSERPNLNAGASNNPTSGTSSCLTNPDGSPVQLGTPQNWFDPCAFSRPAAGTYGKLGRNTVIGPGLTNLDLALGKTFDLGERAEVTFKAEMFNVFNHANFGLPNTVGLAGNGTPSPSAGVITYTTTSARQLQFGLRIGF